MIAFSEKDRRRNYVTTTPPGFPNQGDWRVRRRLLGLAIRLHGWVRISAEWPGHSGRLADHRRRIHAERPRTRGAATCRRRRRKFGPGGLATTA